MSASPRKEAPISRKQRLMAAVASGDECAGAAAAAAARSRCCPPAPASPAAAAACPSSAAALCCFICGGGISRGKERRLQVRAPRGPQPFFPFLQHQEPAPGAREVSAEGCALVCAVCRCFLAEQWDAFERARTPVEKRMYWLKRPYQCEGPAAAAAGGLRRAPQEWNPGYALGTDDERRPGSSPDQPPSQQRRRRRPRGSPAAAPPDDSSLSSLSDAETLSETEPRFPAAPGSPEAGRAEERKRPRRGSQLRPPPEEAAAIPFHPGNGLPLAPKLRRKRQRPARRRARGGLLWNAAMDAFGRSQPGLEAQRAEGPAGEWPRAPSGCCSSEESEINITSDEEPRTAPGGGGGASARGAGLACYVCGSPLTPGSQQRLHVQKQEQASTAPFFPFLWLHSPPPGALPLSPAGSALVCPACHASLTQQWRSFEGADVPVLQRLYVLPRAAAQPRRAGTAREEGPPGAPQPRSPEACYLCGEDCSQDGRPVSAKAPNGSSKVAMHFPFLSHLPCPPRAKGPDQRCQVRSCSRCYLVLQDLWATYLACRNEECIASVQSFLGRYHQVFAAVGEAEAPARTPRLTQAGLASSCYICGAQLSPGKEFQVSINPPAGRFGEKEPFFPFLAVYPPAPRARPAEATGIVATCLLCYHDLLAQWLQHEQSSAQHPSSAWSRQYKVDTFACFFCRQEKKRHLGLRGVPVARLPVFLGSFRGPGTLLVDDGKRLTIGACPECAMLVLAGKSAVARDLLALPATVSLSLQKAPFLPSEASSANPGVADETAQRPPGTAEGTAVGNGARLDRRATLNVDEAAPPATSKCCADCYTSLWQTIKRGFSTGGGFIERIAVVPTAALSTSEVWASTNQPTQ
ncbi:uncharacterized protein LOC120296704, partial [Crotalus tigris]|uniref:uncharacterized protein LOC120296704 n=1 Tax=Crotalus tigris TaxID=88082 RepID=UPI00192F2D54